MPVDDRESCHQETHAEQQMVRKFGDLLVRVGNAVIDLQDVMGKGEESQIWRFPSFFQFDAMSLPRRGPSSPARFAVLVESSLEEVDQSLRQSP